MPSPQYLPAAIEVIHEGMREEQDPRHVQTLAQCLRALTGIQSDYMQQNGQGAQGGQGGQDTPDPRAALLSQLGGQG